MIVITIIIIIFFYYAWWLLSILHERQKGQIYINILYNIIKILYCENICIDYTPWWYAVHVYFWPLKSFSLNDEHWISRKSVLFGHNWKQNEILVQHVNRYVY